MKFVLKPLVFLSAALLVFTAAAANAEISQKQFEAMMDKYLTSDHGAEQIGKVMESYATKRQEMARKQQEQQAAADLENQFKNPVKIDIGKSPVHGPANAKITIIEFSDFQCPYCKRGKDTMDQVMKAYPNDVKVVFKNLPLPFHENAMPAAKAAYAANKQGKFWEMHDALFDNQAKLSPEFYLDQAKSLGLDVEKFKTDMASPEAEAAIKEDMALGSKNGIQGTPGFFVNGVAVKGAYPLDHFKMIIDRWLAKK